MTTVRIQLTTPRLTIVPASATLLEMELASPQHLGEALEAHVPEGWPPGEYDEPAIRWFLGRLAAQPDAAHWFAWYVLLNEDPGALPHLVAASGYKGPPDPGGEVEIGYSVVPAYGRRGIATEIVGALVAHAFTDPRVTRVIAHTFPLNAGSIRVLEKNGFLLEGPGQEEGTIRYGRGRDAESGHMIENTGPSDGGNMKMLEGGPDRDIVTTRVLHAPRERVFRAWTEADHLARWWGPNGFTNTFQEFDPRPGGHWRFVMHGPDGTTYDNACVFLRIEAPASLVLEHVSPPYFHILASFEAMPGGTTRLHWTMRFRTAEECDKLRDFVTGKNEENIDRLEAELATMK